MTTKGPILSADQAAARALEAMRLAGWAFTYAVDARQETRGWVVTVEVPGGRQFRVLVWAETGTVPEIEEVAPKVG